MKRNIFIAALIVGAIVAAAMAVPRSAQSAPACHATCTMPDMPGMAHMNGAQTDMTDMGPHMTMTPALPMHSGDQQRAAQIVSTLRNAIDKYKDHETAERDGFVPFLADVPMPQYHFTNWRNAAAAEFAFDPTKPTSLLYKKTSTGYELIGAMYTAPRKSTLADLDARIPLSVGHWHEHINFCKAPDGAGRDAYFGPDARFGLKGSIATAAACQTAGGTFVPILFNWMVHVYPYESNPADVWKVGH